MFRLAVKDVVESSDGVQVFVWVRNFNEQTEPRMIERVNKEVKNVKIIFLCIFGFGVL